jgi:hypothetical protein
MGGNGIKMTLRKKLLRKAFGWCDRKKVIQAHKRFLIKTRRKKMKIVKVCDKQLLGRKKERVKIPVQFQQDKTIPHFLCILLIIAYLMPLNKRERLFNALSRIS